MREIKADLGRRDISQRTLAAWLGVSPMWVSGRLNGETAISLDDLTAIAAGLGRPVAFFLPASTREVIDFEPEMIRSHPLRSKPARHEQTGRKSKLPYLSRRPGDRQRPPIIRPRKRRTGRNPRPRAPLAFHRGSTTRPIDPGHATGAM